MEAAVETRVAERALNPDELRAADRLSIGSRLFAAIGAIIVAWAGVDFIVYPDHFIPGSAWAMVGLFGFFAVVAVHAQRTRWGIMKAARTTAAVEAHGWASRPPGAGGALRVAQFQFQLPHRVASKVPGARPTQIVFLPEGPPGGRPSRAWILGVDGWALRRPVACRVSLRKPSTEAGSP